jgi:predicted metal-dependent hydrolase
MMQAKSRTTLSIESFDPETLRLEQRRGMRTMRLRMDPRSGALVLSFPAHVSRRRALEWASRQGDWIAERKARLPAAIPLEAGSTIPFRGEAHRIVGDEARLRGVTSGAGQIVVGGPPELLSSRLQRWLKSEARRLLEEDTVEFAQKARVTVSSVAIGDPVSRWGSCASTGAIRYSWRLVLAPDWVRRATVAHEVAHRLHMNHGAAFHALVAELLGEDPAPARAWLKAHGLALHRIAPRQAG